MKIETMNAILDYVEGDIKTCVKDQYHPKCHDLLNILLLEEVPALIAHIRRLNKSLSTPLPSGTGDNYHGFKMALETLKRELYE